MRAFAAYRTSFVPVLAVLLLAISTVAKAADKVPAERRLPSGVLFYLCSPDVPLALEKFRETSFGQMLHDPSLEAFRTQLVEKFHEYSKQGEEELGFPVSDLASLFSGEACVAALRPPGQSLGGVMLLEIGDHRDILDRLLAKAETQMGDSLSTSVEPVEGVDVNVWKIGDAEDASERSVEIVWFVRDETLVVASGLPMAKAILTRWDGTGSSSFAESPIFQTLMSKCRTSERTPAALKWFIDPIGLTSAGLSMTPETQMFAISFNALLPALGVNKLKGGGGVLELATGEYDSIQRSMIIIDPPAAGLLKVFELRPTISAPPDWVPANASTFMAFDWNAAGAYGAVESTADSFMGQPGAFEARLNTYLQQVEGPDLNPKTDIVDTFTGLIQFYTVLQESGPLSVASFGISDSEKANKLLNAVRDTRNSGEITESDGVTTLKLSSDEEGAVLAVQGEHLWVTSKPEQLALTLKGSASQPLARSPEYLALAAKIPEKVCLLSYQNSVGAFGTAFEQLRAGELDGVAEGEFDFSTLPPFESLSKYLHPSASYAVPTEDGVLMVQFSLRKQP